MTPPALSGESPSLRETLAEAMLEHQPEYEEFACSCGWPVRVHKSMTPQRVFEQHQSEHVLTALFAYLDRDDVRAALADVMLPSAYQRIDRDLALNRVAAVVARLRTLEEK